MDFKWLCDARHAGGALGALGGAIVACAASGALLIGFAPAAGATSGRCPLPVSCTVKSSDGTYLTWEPARRPPSPVRLVPRIAVPGSTWELGYDGFEIKVATPGLQLCLALRPARSSARQYGIELARCSGKRDQEWTANGTFTFGRHITIQSVAHRSMCLTASGRTRRSRTAVVVLERCKTRGAPDQTWST